MDAAHGTADVPAERVAPADAEPDDRPPAFRRARRRPRSNVFLVLQIGAVALVAALLALLGWRVATAGSGAKLVSEISRGDKPRAPRFVLPLIWRNGTTWPQPLTLLLSDQRLALDGLRGRPVVLNFWASWCQPCKEEAPRLAAAATAHAGTVAFLGVDVQDLTPDARRFLERFRVRYPSVRDNGGSTYAGYGLTGVPETYWLDARGRIVGHYAGAISREQLEEGIRLAAASR